MSALSFDILAPALLAALLILASHVPLGTIALNRGIVLAGLALAQISALGMVLAAQLWGTITGGWIEQIGAAGAAIVGGAMLAWAERRFDTVREAVAGTVFVTAAAVHVTLISSGFAGADPLRDLLFGRLLSVTPSQLLAMGLVSAAAVAVWSFRDLASERTLFYGVLAVAVTVSVQIAGMLPVFALLVVPALATRRARPRWRSVLAFNVGVVGCLGGVVASVLYPVPAGAAVVCALAATGFIAAGLVARRPGPAESAGRFEPSHEETEARLTGTPAT